MRDYFLKSPFRSVSFSTSAVLALAFVIWGIVETKTMQQEHPCVGNAVLALTLLPVLALIYSLFLHRELRALVEPSGEINQWSRLDALHRGLVGSVLLACVLVVLALTIYCPNNGNM